MTDKNWVPAWGQREDGTFWLKTVGRYDPRESEPMLRLDGRGKSTTTDKKELEMQKLVALRYKVVAGLTRELVVGDLTVIENTGSKEPRPVEIIFPEDS